MHAPRKNTLIEKLMGSRYFLFAVLLHLVVFFMVSTIVLFKAVIPQTDMETSYIAGGGGGEETAPPPPPPNQTVEVPTTESPTASPNDIIATDVAAPDAPPIPVPTLVAPNADPSKQITPIAPPSSTGDPWASRAGAVSSMIKGWGRGSGKGIGIGNGKNTSAVFKCYIAKYAQGDWNSTIETQDGRVKRGSLVNLLYMISEWTHGKIRADFVPVPLDLASTEIFDIKPPFIYFTGHKDFVLTNQEVENLRRYLIQGGCIWGDNGLAGRGSRFDIAFRREMKRVLPSQDQQFFPLPNDHAIYTKSYNPLSGPPPGINFYQEPVEGINMDGLLAIIYTLNDYSDMFRMAYRPGTLIMDLDDGPGKVRVTPSDLFRWREVYYRNFTPEACKASFELGLNIVVHLLTRFDDKLLLSPQ